MAKVITKEIDGGALDVDVASRRVKVAIAAFDNIDRDRDVIVPGAVTRTIKERGPQGTNEIWFLIDHHYSLNAALGKFQELYVGTSGDEANKLVGVATVVKNAFGDGILAHYHEGNINQHSITFQPIQQGWRETTDTAGNSIKYNEIRELALWEGSAVLWGANPMTPTISVGKSMTSKQAIDKLTFLEKCLRSGLYTDENFSLIELQLKAIKQHISDLEEKANQPAVTATDTVTADNSELVARLKQIANIK